MIPPPPKFCSPASTKFFVTALPWESTKDGVMQRKFCSYLRWTMWLVGISRIPQWRSRIGDVACKRRPSLSIDIRHDGNSQTHTLTHIRVHARAHTNAHTHVHTHTHTHTHTHVVLSPSDIGVFNVDAVARLDWKETQSRHSAHIDQCLISLKRTTKKMCNRFKPGGGGGGGGAPVEKIELDDNNADTGTGRQHRPRWNRRTFHVGN